MLDNEPRSYLECCEWSNIIARWNKSITNKSVKILLGNKNGKKLRAEKENSLDQNKDQWFLLQDLMTLKQNLTCFWCCEEYKRRGI